MSTRGFLIEILLQRYAQQTKVISGSLFIFVTNKLQEHSSNHISKLYKAPNQSVVK